MNHEIRSDIAGSVWAVLVRPGAEVAEGDVLVVLESMKLEIPVVAAVTGTVVELRVAPGDPVEEDQVLAVISSA